MHTTRPWVKVGQALSLCQPGFLSYQSPTQLRPLMKGLKPYNAEALPKLCKKSFFFFTAILPGSTATFWVWAWVVNIPCATRTDAIMLITHNLSLCFHVSTFYESMEYTCKEWNPSKIHLTMPAHKKQTWKGFGISNGVQSPIDFSDLAGTAKQSERMVRRWKWSLFGLQKPKKCPQ